MRHAEFSLEKPLDQYLIYRWAQHCLALPAEHVLLPLFWQQFLALALARVPHRASGGQPSAYGIRFLAAKETLSSSLRKRYGFD